MATPDSGGRFGRHFARHCVAEMNRARARAPSAAFIGFTRRILLCLGAAALLASSLHASDPTDAEVEAALRAAGVPPVRRWELTANFRAAVGYKDNVLLSAVHDEASSFARGEAEVFWWLPPSKRFEALAFANVALTRFLESEENPRELQAFAHAEARWLARPGWQLTVLTEGYRLDQVFDLSETRVERLTAKLAVTGGVASTVLRWEPAANWHVELKPTVQRDRYRDGSDDNTQRFGRVTIGRAWREGRFAATIAGQALERDYVRRVRYTVAGRPLLGTDLVFLQREAEARFTAAWDAERRWSTATALGWADNDDNGSGYFDYEQQIARQEITWTRAPWKVRVAGRAARFDYVVQTVGIGIAPPNRIKEEFLGQLRAERQFGPRLTGYLDYTWERSRSNDPLARYRVKTAMAGVDVAF